MNRILKSILAIAILGTVTGCDLGSVASVVAEAYSWGGGFDYGYGGDWDYAQWYAGEYILGY